MAQKKKLQEVRSPRGIAIGYVNLNAADTKFKPEGVFNVKVAFEDMEAADVQGFIAKIEKVRDEFFDAKVEELKADGKGAAAKQLKKADVISPELDRETGDETGRFFVNAKMNASGVRKDGTKWSQKPVFFNAKGDQLKNPPRISGGTVLKVVVSLDPYVMESTKTVGVTLRLKAVQLISLVSGGQRDFGGYGFEAEDGDDIDDAEFDNETADDSDGSAGADENNDI
jgi:hypothetical protein